MAEACDAAVSAPPSPVSSDECAGFRDYGFDLDIQSIECDILDGDEILGRISDIEISEENLCDFDVVDCSFISSVDSMRTGTDREEPDEDHDDDDGDDDDEGMDGAFMCQSNENSDAANTRSTSPLNS